MIAMPTPIPPRAATLCSITVFNFPRQPVV